MSFTPVFAEITSFTVPPLPKETGVSMVYLFSLDFLVVTYSQPPPPAAVVFVELAPWWVKGLTRGSYASLRVHSLLPSGSSVASQVRLTVFFVSTSLGPHIMATKMPVHAPLMVGKLYKSLNVIFLFTMV